MLKALPWMQRLAKRLVPPWELLWEHTHHFLTRYLGYLSCSVLATLIHCGCVLPFCKHKSEICLRAR